MSSFKLYFSTQDVRRIGLPTARPTFAEFKVFLEKQKYPYNVITTDHDDVKIRYRDEDDDMITVSNEDEWSHMLDIHTERTIKLYFQRSPDVLPSAGAINDDASKGDDEGCSSHSDPSDDSSSRSPIGGGFLPSLLASFGISPDEACNLAQTVPECIEALCGDGRKEKDRAEDGDLPRLAREILHGLGGTFIPCAAQGIRISREKCGGKTSCGGARRGIVVDVDMPHILHGIHQSALDALESEEYEKAYSILRILAMADPKDPLVRYNLACTLALQRKSAQALESLRRAISLGYDDWDHMAVDPDLDSLRDLPGWPRRPTHEPSSHGEEEDDQEHEEAESDSVVVEEPTTPTTPVDTIKPYEDERAQLIAMGFHPSERAESLLIRYRGNVSRVVAALLEE